MDKLVNVDISNIADGALMEKFGFSLEKVMEDLNDPNKDPDKKRKIKIVVTFLPKATGNMVGVEIECKEELPPERKYDSHLFKHKDKKTGKMSAVVNVTDPLDIPFDDLDESVKNNEPDVSNLRKLKK